MDTDSLFGLLVNILRTGSLSGPALGAYDRWSERRRFNDATAEPLPAVSDPNKPNAYGDTQAQWDAAMQKEIRQRQAVEAASRQKRARQLSAIAARGSVYTTDSGDAYVPALEAPAWLQQKRDRERAREDSYLQRQSAALGATQPRTVNLSGMMLDSERPAGTLTVKRYDDRPRF